MRKVLLLIFLLFATVRMYANEYPQHDLKRIFPGAQVTSRAERGIDAKNLDEFLADLSTHALNYPPSFDTPEQQRRAIMDVITIEGILNTVTNSPDTDPELLLQLGILNSIGYNLGIDGAANKASTSFQRLLAMAPMHPRGNYMYGVFLAGTARPKEAMHRT